MGTVYLGPKMKGNINHSVVNVCKCFKNRKACADVIRKTITLLFTTYLHLCILKKKTLVIINYYSGLFEQMQSPANEQNPFFSEMLHYYSECVRKVLFSEH